MFIATLVISIVLALALTSSAFGKLSKKPAVVEQMSAVGVSTTQIPILGLLELAGAAGLLIGLFWWPLGVAAAAGVIVYFIGAVIAHLRVNDTKGIGPAVFLGAIAIAALVLRLASS